MPQSKLKEGDNDNICIFLFDSWGSTPFPGDGHGVLTRAGGGAGGGELDTRNLNLHMYVY